MISSTVVYTRMGLRYIVLIYSIFILQNICATEIIQQKDESILDIMKNKDANEGLRRETDPFHVQCPPVVPPPNGHIVGHVSRETGAIVHIQCDSGYHMIGSNKIQCRAVPSPFVHQALWFHQVGDIYYSDKQKCIKVLTTNQPTTIQSLKVRGDVEEESEELNIDIDTDDDVPHPPPLRGTGRAKTLNDDHAHFPSENEFKEEQEEENHEPQQEPKATKVPPNCTAPKHTGPCRASMPRFYYNTISKKCENFIYGGCDSNGNNYLTKEDCEDNCVNNSSDSFSNST